MAKKNLNLNVSGRVKKVKTENVLVALFEAVSNSIHAIEDRNSATGEIVLRVLRQPRQGDLSLEDNVVSGFEIVDNGVGFDDKNMASFELSDSEHKALKGGKGVGRFSWLKFFEKVKVESCYFDHGKWWMREFEFLMSGIDDKDPVETNGAKEYKTTVTLSPLLFEFEEKFRKSSEDIAISLIEHFLAYLVTGALPKLLIVDGKLEINLQKFYADRIGQMSANKTFIIGKYLFNCIGIKNYFGNTKHTIFLCGDKRVADKCLLSTRDDFFSRRFRDQERDDYAYHMFVESKYLDGIVNDDRDGFRFPEQGSLEAFDDSGVTKESILERVNEIVHGELSEEIDKKRAENREAVEEYVIGVAPQYRYILKDHGKEIEKIHDSDPIKIDLALRKIQYEQEVRTKREISDLLKKTDEKSEEAKKAWKERSNELFARLNDSGKANLAGYIVQRKSILELLTKRLDIDGDKFAREEAIHQLIFPMKATSDEVSYEDQNLWIIDERLSYHYYLASDKPLVAMEPIESDSRKEPDIIVFNRPIALNDRPEGDRPESIVIVEFKRPGDSAVKGEKNPVDQVLEYIELIQDGKAENRKGRKIDINKGTYFFGYVICDIEANLKKTLARRNMRETPDERGMFGYFESHRAYIEVISYEKMLDDARKRNRILFDKLQIPPKV